MNVNDVTRTIMQCRPDAILVSSLGTATSSVRLVTSDGPHFYFGAAMCSAPEDSRSRRHCTSPRWPTPWPRRVGLR